MRRGEVCLPRPRSARPSASCHASGLRRLRTAAPGIVFRSCLTSTPCLPPDHLRPSLWGRASGTRFEQSTLRARACRLRSRRVKNGSFGVRPLPFLTRRLSPAANGTYRFWPKPKQVGSTCSARNESTGLGRRSNPIESVRVPVVVGWASMVRKLSRPRGVASKSERSLSASSPAIPLPWPLRLVGKAHLAASAPPTK